jgi:hypothetical protein
VEKCSFFLLWIKGGFELPICTVLLVYLFLTISIFFLVKKPGLYVAKYPENVKDFENMVLSRQQHNAKG